MSDYETDLLEKIFRAIPHMSEFEKGRLYGIAEQMEREKTAASREDRPSSPTQNGRQTAGPKEVQ